MTSVYLGDFCKDYLQIRSTSKAAGVKTSMCGTGGGERVQFIMVHVLLLLSEVKVTKSCPTLCDLMDYTVHGIL